METFLFNIQFEINFHVSFMDYSLSLDFKLR